MFCRAFEVIVLFEQPNRINYLLSISFLLF